jgi:hypothetical protein
MSQQSANRGQQSAPVLSDHSVFVAHNDYGKRGFLALVDLALTRKQIVERIADKELGFTDVFRIDEYNVAEGWARDVTEEIMAEAEAFRSVSAPEISDPVAAHWDHERDLRKHGVVA